MKKRSISALVISLLFVIMLLALNGCKKAGEETATAAGSGTLTQETAGQTGSSGPVTEPQQPTQSENKEGNVAEQPAPGEPFIAPPDGDLPAPEEDDLTGEIPIP